MSRWMTLSSFGLTAWALAGVVRAIVRAEAVAASAAGATAAKATVGAIWLEAMVWLGPAALLGALLAIAVSRPGAAVDPFLARNVRLGVMVALFALVLAWSLGLFAAYLATLAPGSGLLGS